MGLKLLLGNLKRTFTSPSYQVNNSYQSLIINIKWIGCKLILRVTTIVFEVKLQDNRLYFSIRDGKHFFQFKSFSCFGIICIN